MVMGNQQAQVNTLHGVSVAQTMDGSVQEVNTLYQRMRELGIQSLNGTYSNDDREQMDLEFQALYKEIGRIGNSVTFNGHNLLNTDGEIGIQVDFEVSQGNKVPVKTINIGNLDALSSNPTPTSFAKSQINQPTGFDGIINVLGIPLGDSVNISLAGETLNISYDIANGLLAPNTATANNGAGFNSVLANWVNTNSALQTAGYSAAFNSGDGSIVLSNSNGDVSTGAMSFSAIDGPLGAPFSISQTSIPAGTPPPEPEPPGSAMDIRTQASATTSIDTIDRRLGVLTDFLTETGSTLNRLQQVHHSLQSKIEIDKGVRSIIQDADYAKTVATYTKELILNQSATAMLAQSKNVPLNIINNLLR
ncbi:flagellin [Thiomicrorhabdus immobilis]|uniref:Flagellin n=2 Tax=Thiomicrorhabdus immobilis TaxID=2791037 RepID=A0ABN6CY09_9GAMM|nr:flagellin [Thiomicrorhabdus immobilis]